MDEIDKAIEQLDWYFYNDDGGAADPVTKRAYELLKGVIIMVTLPNRLQRELTNC